LGSFWLGNIKVIY